MNRTNRMFRSFMGAALACAAMAGPAAAQDPPTAHEHGRTAKTMSCPKDAQGAIEAWPARTKKAAQALIEKYGQPDVVTARKLVWNDKGQWKRVAVSRDALNTPFPMPHADFIENSVAYRVPTDKAGNLLAFDPSLLIDLTKGTLTSRYDSEKANTLALNLADEIATGKRDVTSAKAFMRTTLQETLAGKSSPYAEKLMFSSSPSPSTPPAEQPPAGQPPATGY